MQSLEAQLKAIADRRNGDMENVVKASITRVGNMVVQGSPVDKGRFINNWMSEINAIDSSTSRAENKSGYDSIYDLRETVDKINIGFSLYFTNPSPYGRRLEYQAWSAQAPSGMLRVSLLHWDKIVKEEVNKRK